MQVILKTLVVIVALVFLGVVMLSTADEFFGGSKVRTLFGMSADALAGDPLVEKRKARMDGGADAAVTMAVDAGAEGSLGTVVDPPDRIFMPASKSAGGLALPHVRERLLGGRGNDGGTTPAGGSQP